MYVTKNIKKSTQEKVLELLADGKFHSGQELGTALNITRSAIWKLIQQLNALGLDIVRVKGKGYQIRSGLELLSKQFIFSYLSPNIQSQITRFEILDKVSSTNQYLLDELRDQELKTTVVLAEYQSHGRGRRGRNWQSPYAKNIYLSLLWYFQKDPGELSGLSLVTGIAIINALQKYGIQDLQLKWPNDVLFQGKKLCGILIEMIAKPHIETSVVIGVGINVDMSNSVTSNDWIDLTSILGTKPDRNQVGAYIIEELINILELFQQRGFCYFLSDWQRYDMLTDKVVTIYTNHEPYPGKVLGVSNKGELIILNSDNQIVHLMQGEVSVRLA